MKKTELAAAIQGAILGLTKLANVVDQCNDELIYINNDNAVSELEQGESLNPLAVVADTVVTSEVVTDTTSEVELDDEKCPWDIRIHAGESADKCSKVASKVVKGGKAWRMRKGCDKDEYEAIKAELIGGNAPSKPVASAPSLPGTKPAAPSLPNTKSAPSLPGVKSEVDENSALRKTTIINMKALVSKFEVDYDDIKEMMVTEFKAAQNGDDVTFGSLRSDQYQQVHDFFAKLVGQYAEIQTLIDDITKIGGAETVADHIAHYFSEYNTDTVGGIHYSQLDNAIATFKAGHQTWVEWANG